MEKSITEILEVRAKELKQQVRNIEEVARSSLSRAASRLEDLAEELPTSLDSIVTLDVSYEHLGRVIALRAALAEVEAILEIAQRK